MAVSGGGLPSYPPFDPDEEISSLPQKWEEWSDGLEDLMAACGITEHERKWSTLKFFGGEKLRKLEKQLTTKRCLTAPIQTLNQQLRGRRTVTDV